MARQEQQQRRNSKSSSSISGRQHQQRQLQLQLPPSFTAILRHFWHEIRWCFAVWFLALEAGWWHGRSSSSAGTARAAAAASADDSTSSGSCSCSCLRSSLLWCFPVRDPRFCSSQQAASTIYSLRFSRMYSLGFPRILWDFRRHVRHFFAAILRHFWHEIRWCFAVSSEFRKRCLAVGFSPWRLVDGTAGAAAAQEQQEQQHQRTTAPAAAAAAAAASVLHYYGVSLSGTHVFAAASRQPVLYSTLRFSRTYSLGFSRISEDTLGTFLLGFGAIFGTKLGGVLLFRVSFEKDVWLLVSRLGGWLMARQEQQQRRNSKSSSISGRQHQQRQLQLQLPPSFTTMVFPCPGPTFLQQPAGSQYYTVL